MSETPKIPSLGGISESDATFRSAELLDIPPRCIKCPSIRMIIFQLDNLDAGKAEILEAPKPAIDSESISKAAEHLGTNPEELRGKIQFLVSHEVESRLDHADEHIDELVPRANEIVEGCDGGPLTMRGRRGDQIVTVTTCMSRLLLAVAPPDTANGYPPVETAAIRREFS